MKAASMDSTSMNISHSLILYLLFRVVATVECSVLVCDAFLMS